MHRLLCILSLLLAFWQVTLGADLPVSEFTSTQTSKARIIEDSSREKDPGIDHFTHLCPGTGAYQVLHQGMDLRSWINLKVNGRTIDLQSQTLRGCPGRFPAKANDIVQWRGIRQGRSFRPYAIIYRMESTSGDEKMTRLETFIVIKLDGENSKVVAHVPGNQGNEKAEVVADKLCRP